MASVRNNARHVVSLTGGKTIAPLEVLDGIDISLPYEENLISEGTLTVTDPDGEPPEPPTRLTTVHAIIEYADMDDVIIDTTADPMTIDGVSVGAGGGGGGAVDSVAGKTGAVTLVEGDISGLVAGLAAKADLVAGKIITSQIPAIAITDVFVVASQAAQLALAANTGDVAVRTDLNQSYIQNGGTSGTMADWTVLLSGAGDVLSVAGRTGAVVLAMADVTGLVAALAAKQDASTAATDAELATEAATRASVDSGLGVALDGKIDIHAGSGGKAADAANGAPIDLSALGGITTDDIDKRVAGHLSPIRINGHSGAFGGGATLLETSWAQVLGSMLQTPVRNRALGGAVGCWPNSGAGVPFIGTTGDGGYASVLQGVDPKRQSAPYHASPGLPIIWYVQNDVGALGAANLRPALEAMRTMINTHRASAKWFNTDFTLTGTYTTTVTTTRNSGASTKLTTTSGDTATKVIPADFDGRDIVVYLCVDSTFVGSVDFAIPGEAAIPSLVIASNGAGGNTVCQPQAEVANKHNVVCRRWTAAATAAGKTLTVTFHHTSGGGIGVDSMTFQSDNPVLVPGCWRPSDAYTEWATWTHGPSAGTDPMNAASIASANAQLVAMCAEWTDNHVTFVPIDDLFNANAAFFVSDHTHPNDNGQSLVAERMYQAILDMAYTWTQVKFWAGAGNETDDVIFHSGLRPDVFIGKKPWSAYTPGSVVGIGLQLEALGASLASVTVKRLSGQTGAMIALVDETGASLATVNNNGQANFNAVSAGAAASVPLAQLGVASSLSSIVALAVKNAAGQTANAQEWQSSAGAVNANVTAAGQANFVALSAGAPASVPVAQLAVASALATTVAFAARGAASQSASTAEFQNSAGAAIAKVDNIGGIVASNGLSTQVAIGAAFGVAAIVFGSAADTLLLRTAAGELTTNRFIAGSAAVGSTPLVAKGAASQTADNLSVVNSASGQLFGITAAGLPRFAVAGNSATTVGAAGGAAAQPATPKGYFLALDSGGATVKIPYHN